VLVLRLCHVDSMLEFCYHGGRMEDTCDDVMNFEDQDECMPGK
jgi:hypothetical protein